MSVKDTTLIACEFALYIFKKITLKDIYVIPNIISMDITFMSHICSQFFLNTH